MRLLAYLRYFKRKLSSYQPLVSVSILKNNLLSNLEVFRKEYPQVDIAPVLKSNAYGHGLVEVATILDSQKVAFFVVDSLFEAEQLRAAGIKSKILVIGYTSAQNIRQNSLRDVSFTVTSMDQLKEINLQIRSFVRLHLKIDTGMHRQGIATVEIGEAVRIIKQNKLVSLEGVCSHLAEPSNEEFTRSQIDLWSKSLLQIKNVFPQVKFVHLAASGGHIYWNKITTNVLRLGIGLYGIDPAKILSKKLRPTLKLTTSISSLKMISRGESVGYDRTFTAEKDMKIATLPMGYYEGVDRRLSDKALFFAGNKWCRLIGRVSMNIATIDVSEVANIKLSDRVIVISEKYGDPNSVESIAKICETCPYEILVHIPAHLRREVV